MKIIKLLGVFLFLTGIAFTQNAPKYSQTNSNNREVPTVTYFNKSKVDEVFAKGGTLFGGNGRNYLILAARREKPGQAEFHEKDTDIIYILQATATFITGGEVVDGKTTAPEEIRGESIKGGETRTLSKGDVIVVPNSTPHQFTEVTNPFLYYVVKVR